MARYRMKPVEVDAFQFAIPMPGMMPTWLMSAMIRHVVRYLRVDNMPYLFIYPEGGGATRAAPLNAWIIRDTHGQISWCSEETFRDIYEPLSWDGPGWPSGREGGPNDTP